VDLGRDGRGVAQVTDVVGPDRSPAGDDDLPTAEDLALPARAPLRRRGVWRLGLLVAVVALAAAVPVLAVLASRVTDERLAMRAADPSATPAVDVTIPAGTGARLDRGEVVDLLPERLVVHVGDTIRITNDDDRGHLAGPFFVGAGETLRQTFTRPGEVTGECSIHSSGQITVDVLP
jgi:plastocyanin